MINTSYNEIGKITPLERQYIIEFISNEIKMTKEKAEQRKNSMHK